MYRSMVLPSSGTALGDPIEVGGMSLGSPIARPRTSCPKNLQKPDPVRLRKSTLGKGRLDENPLVLAATKSIIGHTEGSAGVAGGLAM